MAGKTTQKQTATTDPTSAPTSGPQTSPDVPTSNEAARNALGRANYESALGSTIGGLLWEQIEDNLSSGKIDGYIAKGGSATSQWLYEQMLAHATPEEVEQLRTLRPEIDSVVQQSLVTPLQQSGLGASVQGWAAEHPRSVAALGVLGAAGYVASNPALEGDLSHTFGDNHRLSLGGEFGRLFDPSVDAIRGGYRYQDADTTIGLSGEHRFDADAWSIAGSYQQRADFGTWSATGSHEHTAAGDVTRAGLGFTNDKLRASLSGSYDSGADLGRIDGAFSTANERGPVWTGGFGADTRGAWNANLGVSEQRDALGWFARIGAGQNAEGKTDLNAMAGLRLRF